MPPGNSTADDSPASDENSAHDFNAVRSALIEGGAAAITLWVSYLFLLLYLAVTVGTVTHRDLFLESRLKLPILNVDLPLLAFCIIAPLLFVFLHLYMLIHFNLLAARAGRFNDELRCKLKDPCKRDLLRQQLSINVFVQYLAGQPENPVRRGESTREKRALLWLIIHVPMLFCSALLMLLFQWRFLPHRGASITWFHSVMLFLILALSFWYWYPRGSEKEWLIIQWSGRKHFLPEVTAESKPTCSGTSFKKKTLKRNLAWVGCAFAILVSLSVSLGVTVPCLQAYAHGLLDDSLDVPGLDLSKQEPPFMVNRDLQYVNLQGAKLPNADFSKANLTRAVLKGANLSDAKLLEADLTDADLTDADLTDADLTTSQNLTQTQIDKACGTGAKLPKGVRWPGKKCESHEAVVLGFSNPIPVAAPDLIATRDLEANHVLAAADLHTDAGTALIDHVLLEPVKAGKPIKAAMVSKAKVPRSRANAIAAVLSVPAAVRAGNGIDVGAFVSIFRGATPFGPPGRVIGVDCEDETCSLIVALPRTDRTIDPDALAAATLERVAAPIAPPAPPPTTRSQSESAQRAALEAASSAQEALKEATALRVRLADVDTRLRLLEHRVDRPLGQAEWKDIQTKLADYSPGKPDGRKGKGTCAAIRRYQQKSGSDVTGVLTPEQIRALLDQTSIPPDVRLIDDRPCGLP